MNGISDTQKTNGVSGETQGKESEIAKLFKDGGTYNKKPFYLGDKTPEDFFGPYYDEEGYLRFKPQPKEDRED